MKALYRLQGTTERLALRREGAEGLLAAVRSDLAEIEAARETASASAPALEAAAAEATAAARLAAAASGAAAERARAAQERLAALERTTASRLEERLKALRIERRGLEAELADAAGGREGAASLLYRLAGVRERIASRHESAAALRERLRLELAESRRRTFRPLSGGARSGCQRGDRGCTRGCPRAGRLAGTRDDRARAPRGARTLACRAGGNSTGGEGPRGRGCAACALAARRRAR